MMTPEALEQTSEVLKFLRESCPVCLIPHDPKIHAATLRLRQPVNLEKRQNDGVGAFRTLQAISMGLATAVEAVCECGAVFQTLNPAVRKRCPSCAAGAKARKIAKSNERQKARRLQSSNSSSLLNSATAAS